MRASRATRGLTLVELLVAATITALVVSSICGIYFAVVNECRRQQGQADALVAVSTACSSIGAYISEAVGALVVTRFIPGDTLMLNMPADTAYGRTPVPTWSGGRIQYRSGSWIVFYLSDATGSYKTTGDILWAGTVNWSGSDCIVSPDRSWSMYYDQDLGRIAPLRSLQFAMEDTALPKIGITAVSAYKIGETEKQLRQTATVCMPNAN